MARRSKPITVDELINFLQKIRKTDEDGKAPLFIRKWNIPFPKNAWDDSEFNSAFDFDDNKRDFVGPYTEAAFESEAKGGKLRYVLLLDEDFVEGDPRD